MSKANHIKAVQDKALEDKQERLYKLNMSKKMNNDIKKYTAEQKKEEAKQLNNFATPSKIYSELEKRAKVDEEGNKSLLKRRMHD